MRPRCFLAGGLLIAVATVVGAAERPQVTPRLMVESGKLDPGSTIRVGVLFELEPGWHVYWKNPGDSGLATEVVLAPPEGFEIGPLDWPLPERFVQPGDLIAYGYSDELLLAAELLVPENLGAGDHTLSASVSWLACKNECVLGSAELEQRLPASPGAIAAEAFSRWRQRLPRRGVGGVLPFTVSVVGGLGGARGPEPMSLWLQFTEAPGEVEWFPEAGDRLEIAEPRIRTRGNLTRIDFAVSRIGEGDAPVDRLRSLVVTTDPGGHRVGWEIEVPLKQPT